MKINLLNDGGYTALDSVEFPIEVEAHAVYNGVAMVSKDELNRIASDDVFSDELYPFVVGEYEVGEVSE